MIVMLKLMNSAIVLIYVQLLYFQHYRFVSVMSNVYSKMNVVKTDIIG